MSNDLRKHKNFTDTLIDKFNPPRPGLYSKPFYIEFDKDWNQTPKKLRPRYCNINLKFILMKKLTKNSWWNIAVGSVVSLLICIVLGASLRGRESGKLLIENTGFVIFLVVLFFFVFYAIYRYRKTPRF